MPYPGSERKSRDVASPRLFITSMLEIICFLPFHSFFLFWARYTCNTVSSSAAALLFAWGGHAPSIRPLLKHLKGPAALRRCVVLDPLHAYRRLAIYHRPFAVQIYGGDVTRSVPSFAPSLGYVCPHPDPGFSLSFHSQTSAGEVALIKNP